MFKALKCEKGKNLKLSLKLPFCVPQMNGKRHSYSIASEAATVSRIFAYIT
jgi:hypothetical protein